MILDLIVTANEKTIKLGTNSTRHRHAMSTTLQPTLTQIQRQHRRTLCDGLGSSTHDHLHACTGSSMHLDKMHISAHNEKQETAVDRGIQVSET